MNDYDSVIKLILIGDAGVGKSCITSVFCDNKFTDYEQATIGVDFRTKNLILDDRKIKLQIWDTAGQERFRSITNSYFRNVHGVILVFDLTKYESFQNLNKWLDEIEFFMSGSKYQIILVGNKSDDEIGCRVLENDIEKFIDNNKIEYMEISAKKNINIEKLFEIITTNILNSKINTTAQNVYKPIIKIHNNPCCHII